MPPASPLQEAPTEAPLYNVHMVDGVSVCAGPRRSGRTTWAIAQAVDAVWDSEQDALIIAPSEAQAKLINATLHAEGIVGVEVASMAGVINRLRGKTWCAVIIDDSEMHRPAVLDEVSTMVQITHVVVLT